jgi:beta-lactamase superfamily II metal-dependent hydrolase
VVQAQYGDCFILESKIGKDSVNILIDGGPYQTFEKHLKPALRKLPLNGKLDLMVLSHIDNDHIIGLIDLLEHLKTERQKGTKELIKIEKLWHNSFNDLFELKVEPKILFKNIFISKNILSGKQIEKNENFVNSIVVKGFQQGSDLTQLANSLSITINPEFKKLISVDDSPRSVCLGHITFQILGPTKKNLDKLKEEWKDWTRKEERLLNTQLELFQILDKSIPNLASIMFLANIKNKRILFTGDGIGQDIIRILSQNSMLDKYGKFHVEILKVPHHGSDRNASIEFFNTVYADYYIISANGRDDNPSQDTLKWIIESNKNSKYSKKIVLTNMTPKIRKTLKNYDQKMFNYACIVLEKKEDFLTIKF